jgi:bile acid:Na+ symporter, BASS family
MMFSVGLGLRAHRRAAPAPRPPRTLRHRALLLNLVLVPGVAAVLARALHLRGDVAAALILVAVSPGGRFTPHLTRLAAGDVSVATGQLLVFSHFAVFTAPLTARWLLGIHHLDVVGSRMVIEGCVLQLVPLYAGDALARRRGEVAERLERALRPVVAVITVAVIVVLVVDSGVASLELLGDRGWLAVGAVAAAAMAMGALLAGRDAAIRRAFVVGAASRNLALALLVAGLAFPHTRVQLAVFGVWWIFVGAGYAYARIVRRLPTTSRASE